MATIDNIRNNIIDKLLAISNKEYLSALYQIVEKGQTVNSSVELTEEQILMLQLSMDDIKNGRTITQEQLDKEDLEWLKGK